MVFSIFALVLSLGGLQRERAAGTAGFTLALPVTRSRLLIVRVATGLVELTAVALLPALIIPALSPPLLHQSYPFSQALGFTLLYMSWGTVWFGIGVLWSVLFAGEYTAAVLSMLTPFGYMIVYSNISQGGRRFLMANPMEFTSGLGGGFIRMGWMFIDFMPWPAIATLLAVGATLLVASTLIVRRQNF
jgi:ABC-type transport system involved in multi-copper enzyme maturation permease subunit